MLLSTIIISGLSFLVYPGVLGAVLPEDAVVKRWGECGPGFGRCPNNLCCSKWGYCGDGDGYCGKDCQPAFGRCDIPIPDGSCGPGIGSCQNNLCCSKWGFCGDGNAYCAPPDCQVGFGRCDVPLRPCGPFYPPCPAGQCCSGSPWGFCQACPPNHPVTPDGSCGPRSAGPYRCRDGYCCSSEGWCGDQVQWCGAGCQPEYGRCN